MSTRSTPTQPPPTRHAWPVIIEDEVTGQSDEPVVEALAVVLPREPLPALGGMALAADEPLPPMLEHLWQRLGGRRFGGWQFVDRTTAVAVRAMRRAAEPADTCVPIALGPDGAVVGMRGQSGGAVVLWPANDGPRTIAPVLAVWLAELLAWTEQSVGDPILR